MQVVTSTQDLKDLCQNLAANDYVTVDTEFLREQTFWPKLCLVQLAGPGIEAIVDPLAPGLALEPLWELMADETTVKVFHAARQDLEIVWTLAGIIPNPIFDTQVAAMVCGFGDSVSYSNLVKKVTGKDIDKSSRFTDWSRRPLSEKQLAYALGDVTHLRNVYGHLEAQLDKAGRHAWLDEEMAVLTAPTTYQTHPEEAWKRLKLRVKNRKALSVLMELAAWRERLAQAQDVPRGRIMKDEVLYDIANQAPTATDQLSRLRSLSDGFSRSSRAKEIVEAVKKGLDRDMSEVPPLRQGEPLTAEATATVELLKVLLKSAAARHGVAPRLLADASDLEKIAAQDEPDVAAMHGWRRQLFGEDALALKRGELALSLKNGEVAVYRVGG
ncbi:MAG: ribonuclease D [Hyphomicrobiaceae bacterium]|nr:ribonuclease D [Hyphomicrobiaceae bacterium]MCC0007288.1 ribonuclease D [Hyphomicrobiaceae bacterium]